MPRVPLEDPPKKITLSIPSSVLAQVELRLINPLTMQPAYGAVSQLMTSLIKRWLSEQKPVVNPALTTPLTSEPSKESEDGNTTNT